MKQRISKKIASLLVCFILAQAMFATIDMVFKVVPRASGTTIFVDDSGGADFTSIQEAVDAAKDGDTIFVFSGIYKEHVSIDKSLTLRGENKDTTIIDGGGTGEVIHAQYSLITVEEFTIRNGRWGILFNLGDPNNHAFNNIITDCKTGIESWSEATIINSNSINNCGAGIDHIYWYELIYDNTISNSHTGINSGGSYNSVYDNTINNCERGICVGDSGGYNSIYGNTISNCNTGMYIKGNYNNIYNNVINANDTGLCFELMSDFNFRNYIAQSNTVNGETVYHFFDVHGTPSSPIVLENMVLDKANISNTGKISLVDCSYIKIKNNVLLNNYPGSGIFIFYSENITIEGNFMENNTGKIFIYEGGGIQMFCSKNITIVDNSILNNLEGISSLVTGVYNEENINLIIENNYISNNSDHGIYLYSGGYKGKIMYNKIFNNSGGIVFEGGSSSNNARYYNITNNAIIGNLIGVIFNRARYNTVENNTIIACKNTGFRSRYYSRYNTLSNNTIESYGYGFEFYRDSDNTYVNNTVSGVSYDIRFSGGSPSHVTLLNCPFNKSKVYYSCPESTLTVQWYLDVNVTNSLFEPIPNATVCVKDSKNSLPIQKYKTDSEGYVHWLVETEYIEQDTNGDTIGEKTYCTPHKITAWNETLLGFAEVNMNESKGVNVVLGTPYYEIPLKAGWNLISLPLVQPDTNISTVLKSIAGNYNIIQWFNASDKKWHSTNDNLTNLDHTMGFWIHMKTADTLLVNGSIPYSTSIQLYQGWNLVGNPSFCIHAINEILDSIDGNYTAIQWYDASDKGDSWKHHHIGKPSDLNDLKYMTCCRGYWIYVKEDRVWEVNNL